MFYILFAHLKKYSDKLVFVLLIFIIFLAVVAISITPRANAADVVVTVTEKIPGAGCVEDTTKGKSVTQRQYKCTVKGGFETVQGMLGGLIKYATFITALLGVLMVVFSGLQYATSGGNSDAQKAAVGRIQALIAGMLLLFLVGFILNTIAPWIYN